MPGYRTHISASSVVGIALGGVSFFCGKIDLMTSIYGGALCAIGGMIPDIDSKTSESFRKCLAIVAGFSSLLIVSRLRDFPMDPQSVAIIGGGNFVLVWFFLGNLIKKMTVHRGMCHSIPMAVLVGEIIFLLSSGGINERLYCAVSALIGVMVHLILDEFYSVQISRGVKIKKSLGSAMKLVNFDNLKASAFILILLGFVTYLTIHEPVWSENFTKREKEKTTLKNFGKEGLEQIQTRNADIYDLSVVEWVAQNDMTLRPKSPNNPKWRELEQLLNSPQKKPVSRPEKGFARQSSAVAKPVISSSGIDILKMISGEDSEDP